MSAEKTISEVYDDRNVLALGFCDVVRRIDEHVGDASFRSGWHTPTDDDDADADEWAILWAQTPQGQVSWHVPRYLAEASRLGYTRLVWDGHTRQQKNARLRRLAVGL